MMDFFTRCCKKNNNKISDKNNNVIYAKIRSKIFIYLALFLTSVCLFANNATAASSIQIKSAELQAVDEFYTLSADIDINFDDTIEEAINKGVPLTFVIEFQAVSPRKYWFDDEIVTASTNVMLSYHALSRQYLVNRGSHQKSFETLSEAKQELSELSDWKVLDKALIEKGEIYNAALLMRLDQAKLPKAIQVDSIASEKWNLSSQKFAWPLKDLFTKETVLKDSAVKDSSVKEVK